MKYKSMTREDILNAIEYYLSQDNNAFLVTLTDGSTLCGNVGSLYDENISEVIENDSLPFGIVGDDYDMRCWIPLNQISGISAFKFYQEGFFLDSDKENPIYLSLCQALEKKYEQDEIDEDYETEILELIEELKQSIVNGKYHSTVSFIDYCKIDLCKKCEKHNFVIESDSGLCFKYKRKLKPFAWGKIDSSSEWDLYADFEYINNISGGINSVGIGCEYGSISVAWGKSLYSERKKLMRKPLINIGDITEKTNDNVVIEANLDFYYAKVEKKKIVQYQSFEGDKWLPVILSNKSKRSQSLNDLKDEDWCIGYMREKDMLIPHDAFETVQHPLKIQGQVIPIPVKTQMGDKNFIIKIRNISSYR